MVKWLAKVTQEICCRARNIEPSPAESHYSALITESFFLSLFLHTQTVHSLAHLAELVKDFNFDLQSRQQSLLRDGKKWLKRPKTLTSATQNKRPLIVHEETYREKNIPTALLINSSDQSFSWTPSEFLSGAYAFWGIWLFADSFSQRCFFQCCLILIFSSGQVFIVYVFPVAPSS